MFAYAPIKWWLSSLQYSNIQDSTGQRGLSSLEILLMNMGVKRFIAITLYVVWILSFHCNCCVILLALSQVGTACQIMNKYINTQLMFIWEDVKEAKEDQDANEAESPIRRLMRLRKLMRLRWSLSIWGGFEGLGGLGEWEVWWGLGEWGRLGDWLGYQA